MRSAAWFGLEWKFVLIHGVVRSDFEVECIEKCGVQTIPLHEVLADLRHENATGIRGLAGTDLSEIIEYYNAMTAR